MNLPISFSKDELLKLGENSSPPTKGDDLFGIYCFTKLLFIDVCVDSSKYSNIHIIFFTIPKHLKKKIILGIFYFGNFYRTI